MVGLAAGHAVRAISRHSPDHHEPCATSLFRDPDHVDRKHIGETRVLGAMEPVLPRCRTCSSAAVGGELPNRVAPNNERHSCLRITDDFGIFHSLSSASALLDIKPMAHIRAEGIVVDFPIYNASHRSLKTAVLRATTGGRIGRDSTNRVVVRAIDHLSFEICDGDRVGLVGQNGSGKTTLLRVLSGIYEPQGGTLEVRGRAATLLDLNLGIDPEATGYDNIMFRGIMAGLHPKVIKARMEEIADFTELGDYLEMPVRTYSSGMQVRLAFAVATSVEADVLLMDEWLSVGDAEFSKKAAQRLERLVNRTPILVLATHNQKLVEETCNRVFMLEHGRIASVIEHPNDLPLHRDNATDR